ncbi:MAG TPA: hypothetical protein DCY07_06115 [Rhodospirillaceae bacterium]|nr:hypothetical protein [Rhodospirillaceae bacterium]
MNTKKIITALLLLFVVASVGTIVAKESGVRAPETPQIVEAAPIVPSEPAKEQKVAPPEAEKQQEIAAPTKVVAYYFHGNVRCVTCRKLEELTTEAIQGGFAQGIKDGRVELKIINLDEPGNEHYAQDYQLATRSVVLARFDGQTQKSWKRLDEIWQLVRGDREAFLSFVRGETAALLNADKS